MSSKKLLWFVLAALLLLYLAPMPYGYFMLVRFVMLVAFAWMAVYYYQKGMREMAWTFGALAILFQPIAKIALGTLGTGQRFTPKKRRVPVICFESEMDSLV